MLMEMNDKAQHLVKLMKQGIVEFIFTKISTGKKRKAHGTLKRDLIPQQFQRKRGRPKKHPNYLVIYYDTDKKDIRSFRDELLDKIVSKKPFDPKTNDKKDQQTDKLNEKEQTIKKKKRHSTGKKKRSH